MNKERKQIVVLVSLVAVVGAIGAFQFMAKGPSTDIVAKADPEPSGGGVEVSVPTLPELDPNIFLLELENRDPFIPQAVMAFNPVVRPLIDTRPPNQIDTGDGDGPIKPFPPDVGTGIVPAPLAVLSLRGVILGPKPLAVFQGVDGRQRLVAEGETLSNGAVVLSIGDGKVILKKNGKIRTMEFEEA